MSYPLARLLFRVLRIFALAVALYACADDREPEALVSGLDGERTLGSLDDDEAALLLEFRQQASFQPSQAETCKITAVTLHEERCSEAEHECVERDAGPHAPIGSTSERFKRGLARCAQVAVKTYERCIHDRERADRHLYEESSCEHGLVFDVREFCEQLGPCVTDV
jgi:hypothetical protein